MSRETDKTIAKMIAIADKKEKGMTLVSASTGKGKTYEVVGYAVDSIDSGRYEKVIFIEPRHSIFNDVINDLKYRGVGSEQILYLRSSIDNALASFETIDTKAIKDKSLKEMTNDLIDCCTSCKSLEKDTHLFDELIIKRKSEIKKYCIRNKSNLNEDDLSEINKVFPEEIKKSHKYILMTMDKVFHTLDILKKENRILSSTVFSEKTLVIIDELDKCYAIALNKLADNKDTLEDMLAVIQNAYAFISDADNRWQAIDDEEDNKEIEEEKRKLLEEIDKLNEEYGILNNFVFEQKEDNALELFVSRSQTFIASKKRSYRLRKEKQKTIIEQWPQRTDFNIIGMAVRCKETVRHILNFIYILGEKYRKQDHDASYEEGLYYGISQVFNKTLAESDYYLNYAMDNSIKTQSLRIDKGEFVNDKSVCNNGFSHCVFDNKPGTNHTYMTSSGIDLTPENVFAWMAKKSNVIGLSATQQIPTVASLDIDYERRVLGDSFDCYSREDFEIANANIQVSDNIICDVIRSFSANRENLYKAINLLFVEKGLEEKKELKNIVFEATDAIDKKYEKDFDRDREYKRFYALCRFALEEKAMSGIVILNSYYSIEPYIQFIKRISDLYQKTFLDIQNIYFIKAENIEYKLDEIKDKLNGGQKCLVISNKEAIGQGINIQYDRDFNFFYQEEPTHIFPVVQNGEPLIEQEKNKLVYLVMKMASNNEISEADMKSWISRSLKGENHESKKFSSIKNAKTSIFIQGLGRASRTASKEEYEFIYFDEALCDVLSLENLLVEKTPELLAVERKVKEYKENAVRQHIEAMDETEKQLCANSNKLQRIIEDLLTTFTGKNMTSERIQAKEKYKRILEVIYKYGPWPTSFDPTDQEIVSEIGYVKVEYPKDLWVLSEEENYCENLAAVSTAYNDKMHQLNWDSVLNIKQYSKPEGECWMINPKAFNLLQGTVGERKFESLFKDEIDFYQLKEPDLDEYEVCGDFKVKDTNIYIDVKNFNENRGKIDLSVFAQNKLEMIRERNPEGKLIVVNVYAKGQYRKPDVDEEDILIVSNVLKELNIKHRENISSIADWIDDANS